MERSLVVINVKITLPDKKENLTELHWKKCIVSVGYYGTKGADDFRNIDKYLLSSSLYKTNSRDIAIVQKQR